jgi:hypothetical protein
VYLTQLPILGVLVLWLWSRPALFRLTLLEAHAIHDPRLLTPELLAGYIRANLSDVHRRVRTRRFLTRQLDAAHARVTLDLLPGLRASITRHCSSGGQDAPISDPSGRNGCAATSPARSASRYCRRPAIC